MLKRLALTLFFLLICSLEAFTSATAAMAPQATSKEPLFYTIQVATYNNKTDALHLYKILKKQLPEIDQAFLRIAKISNFFTIRIGKENTKHQLADTLKRIKRFVYNVRIMRAYYRTSRIITPTSNPINKKSSSQEPLFYTIQVATYNNKKTALPLYRLLKEKLPAADQAFLRIAKISNFFTIRIGKENTRQQLKDTLKRTRKFVHNVHVMRAYYRTSRIITPVSSPIDKPKDLPSNGKTQKLLEDITTTAPKSLLATPTPITNRHKPKLSGKEVLTALMDKYLSAENPATDKAKQYARQTSQKIAATPNCLTSNCHAKLLKVKLPHLPVKEAKCSGCHKQGSKQHPSGQPNDFTLPKSGTGLCQKCHKDIIKGKIVHAPAQKEKCITCHNPHGSDNKNLMIASPNNQKALCLACHNTKGITAFKFMHGPVDLGACTFCHNPHSSTEPNLLRKPPRELCLTCHTSIENDLATMPSIHSPVKEKGCLICHLPHGSQFPKLLKKAGENLCFDCHQDIQDKLEHSKAKHAAIYQNKQCATCHNPHFSKYKNLLIKPEKDLCLTCHQSNSAISGFRPKDIATQIKDKEYLHGPIKKGKCSGCHNPHGSGYDSLLTGPMITSFYAPYNPDDYDLCFICHDSKLLSEKETSDATKFRNGNRNLHFVHVAKEHKGRTCKACHQTHASDGPKLISKTGAQFGTWHISIDFKLNKFGGSCTPSCHRSMVYDRIKPKNNSAKETKYGTYYVDYKSNSK